MKKRDKVRDRSRAKPSSLTPEEVIETRRRSLEIYREFFALLRKIIFIVIAVWALFSFLFGIGIVRGEGMYPRMRDGDVVLWYRLERDCNIGDTVTFVFNGERQYGRIVARSGDTVDFSDDGFLILNGSAQQEEVFFQTLKENCPQVFPMTLKKDEVFILGDNRPYSVDSRNYGPVPVARLEGKILSLMRRRGI